MRKLVGHVGLGKSSGEEVSFTADSRFVVSGSNDGKVYFWDLGTEDLTGPETMERPWVELRPCAVAKSSLDPGPSRCVRFNPRHQMMAVGGNELVSDCTFPAGQHADPLSVVLDTCTR